MKVVIWHLNRLVRRMLRVALIALAHRVTSTTVDLSQDWVVATDANAEAALDAVVDGYEWPRDGPHVGKVFKH